MADFNFAAGPIDPNSLPALLRQKMAPGLVPGPVQPLPITSGFRVPAGVSLPGMSMPGIPMPASQPGFGFQDGARILSDALSRLPRSSTSGPPILNAAPDAVSAQAMDPLTGFVQDLGFGGGVETGGVPDIASLMSSLDPLDLSSGLAGLFGGGAAAGGAAAAGAGAVGADAAAGGAAAAGAGAAGAEAAGFSIADLLPFLAVLAA
jgi:hypothetical protein